MNTALHDRQIEARVGGQPVKLSTYQVLDWVRQATRAGLPPVATNYRTWAVEVDGQYLAAKWLLSQLTGIPVGSFISHQARDLFSRLGFQVHHVNEQTGREPTPAPLDTPRAARSDFFHALSEHVLADLSSEIEGLYPRMAKGRHYIQFVVDRFSGSHYEVIIHRNSYEVALHFESSRELSLRRLDAFRPEVEALASALAFPVRAEPWGARWARLYLELPPTDSRTADPAALASLLCAFIRLTYPTLVALYADGPGRRSRRSVVKETPGADTHAILDREVAMIRDFVNGSKTRPSDEKLCDWVHFCYTFELFGEGQRIFALIDPSQVHPWYYERTRRLARICELRMVRA
jgi:hypothetical protein